MAQTAEKKEIKAGGVTFTVEYRHFGGDRGPSVRVYGDVGGMAVQLLRFDCFEKDPHYHYDPDGKNEMHHLDPKAGVDAHVQWMLSQLRDNLTCMVKHAGYEQAAARINTCEVNEALCQVEEAICELTPKAG